jgi:hypothetical protein
MGRPLNKHKIEHLAAYTANGTYQVTKQKSSKKFLLDNGDVYTLVANDTPGAGEMYLKAYLPDSTVITVAKISNRKLTGSDGNTYAWISSASQVTPEDGYVWVESWEYYC